MNRVNTVRSGNRWHIASTIGNTRSIQGVLHGPSDEKRRCMSTHRCTVLGVNGIGRRASIIETDLQGS